MKEVYLKLKIYLKLLLFFSGDLQPSKQHDLQQYRYYDTVMSTVEHEDGVLQLRGFNSRSR